MFLAAVAVAAGAADRLSDGTTTLVLTHPVSSLTVLLGQFLGASLALGQAGVLLTVVLVVRLVAGTVVGLHADVHLRVNVLFRSLVDLGVEVLLRAVV